MSVQEFRDHEISRLERSGWATNTALRRMLDAVGLRPPAQVVAECMDEGVGEGSGGRWTRAERVVARLREHFASFRFADDVDYGLLAIPAADRFDTRGAVEPDIRCGQLPDLVEDRRAELGHVACAHGHDEVAGAGARSEGAGRLEPVRHKLGSGGVHPRRDKVALDSRRRVLAGRVHGCDDDVVGQ